MVVADTLPKDTLPKDTLPKDILPKYILPMDVLPNGYFTQWLVILPKHFDKITSLFSASCPFGKLSVRQDVRSAKCPFGKMSFGKMSFGKVSFGKISVYHLLLIIWTKRNCGSMQLKQFDLPVIGEAGVKNTNAIVFHK
jgi:hypothetical protein